MYDLIIIGAGPSGLSCAIEAQQAGLNYLVIDKGSFVNAIHQFQRDMFFFSTPELLEIGNVPFVVSTARPTSLDCINYYRGVIEFYKLQCKFYETIISCSQNERDFILIGSSRGEYRARAVVIATGYYDTPNPLDVSGESLPHVSHYYRDASPYYQQDVTIIGGKNSAVEAALDLFRHGARVTMVHRGAKLSGNVKYWILPDFENRVAEGSIKFFLHTTVKQFLPGSTVVQHFDGREQTIKTDFAFVLIGYRPEISFLRSFGIEIDAESLVPTFHPETYETNVHNLFVAGGLVGGKFNNKVFIENGREHGKRIVARLLEKKVEERACQGGTLRRRESQIKQ